MTSPRPTVERRARARAALWLLVALYAALLLLHLPVINLPYYWDEAGYFIPAARDILLTGDPVPHSTLSNAHPPLLMAYLALAWKLFGFSIWVTRASVLFVAALALLGLFHLAERVANRQVAWGTVVCMALYPVFFAQSALAHLDMSVAALTIWALYFYLPARDAQDESATGERRRRRRWSILLLALACVTKETAALVPLTLCAWELVCWLASRVRGSRAPFCLDAEQTLTRALALLLALVPLAGWFAYHRYRTGYTFGNPEYFRYNVEATFNLARVLAALWGRTKHLTFHMNLYVLTAATICAMFFAARREAGAVRTRIDVRVQLVFALLVVVHLCALSLIGGAVLARYMLPVYPLLMLVCVSTIWRRVRHWRLVIAAVCLAFVVGNVVNPPYSFPWEENLAYRDFVLLHRDAARFLAERYPTARVLTTWPASDELRNPDFGYTPRSLSVLPVENFTRQEVAAAARDPSRYDVALLFSTHGGVDDAEAAELLGGRVVYRAERRGQWVAVVETGHAHAE